MPGKAPRKLRSETREVFLYFGILTALADWVTPNNPLLFIPTSYLLKNQLHATAAQVSMFQLVIGIPVYFGCVFGMIRDRWNPFGLGDRGLFFIFGSVTAAIFGWIALSGLSFEGLLIGMLTAILAFQFIASGFQGLITMVGQDRLMTGRLSALWNTLSSLAAVTGAFISGYLSERLTHTQTFLLMAILASLIAILSVWKPAGVFGHSHQRSRNVSGNFVADARRLLRHRAIYPVVIIFFLWENWAFRVVIARAVVPRPSPR